MIVSVEEDKKKLRWTVVMVHNNENALNATKLYI